MSDTPTPRTKRASAKPQPVHDDLAAIAERAYQKFVARGFAHGHDREDWTAAEAELAAERATRRPRRAAAKS
jgi:hypothetical protein